MVLIVAEVNYLKILVTGATGFIGKHVVNELSKYNYDIITTSRFLKNTEKFYWFKKNKYLPYDLNERKLGLYNYFEKPDVLIHLAWENLPNYKDLMYIEKNLTNSYFFIKNLFESGLKELIVLGTCFEYGLKEGCLYERIVPNPVTSYGLAKITLYNFILELKKNMILISNG